MPIHPDPDGSRRRALSARQRAAPKARRPLRRLLWWAGALALLPFAASVLAVAALRYVPPPTTAFILTAQFEAWRGGHGLDAVRQHWVPAPAIAPLAALAVIAAEDQKFPRHHGFDLAAVEQALAAQRAGGRLRGASTITQQVAKNLFLWSGRSWLRKGLEAGFTVLLEAFLPKARILEIYLNVAEFGPGVYGVATASERYFAQSPSRLSAAQAALLAAVLPAPKRWLVRAPSDTVRARQRWIQEQMQRLGGPAMLGTFGWPRALAARR